MIERQNKYDGHAESQIFRLICKCAQPGRLALVLVDLLGLEKDQVELLGLEKDQAELLESQEAVVALAIAHQVVHSGPV